MRIFTHLLHTSLLTITLLGLGGLIAPAQVATEAWVQRYSTKADSDDQAENVITDADGNVIVAGSTITDNYGEDWLIIKYSGAGVPVWTNFYVRPGYSRYGQVKALAVGTNANIYVTGIRLPTDLITISLRSRILVRECRCGRTFTMGLGTASTGLLP